MAKWCCTNPSDTPAAAATPRSDVAAVPCVAKLRNAALRMRSMLRGSTPVPSDSDLTLDTVDNVTPKPRFDNTAVLHLRYKRMVEEGREVVRVSDIDTRRSVDGTVHARPRTVDDNRR